MYLGYQIQFYRIRLSSQRKVLIRCQQRHRRENESLVWALRSMWFVWREEKKKRSKAVSHRAEEVQSGSGWLLCLAALHSGEGVLVQAVLSAFHPQLWGCSAQQLEADKKKKKKRWTLIEGGNGNGGKESGIDWQGGILEEIGRGSKWGILQRMRKVR